MNKVVTLKLNKDDKLVMNLPGQTRLEMPEGFEDFVIGVLEENPGVDVLIKNYEFGSVN